MKTLFTNLLNKNSKSSDETPVFVYIISALFLLTLLVGNFLGLLYLLDGNIAISIILSFVLVILYFFVIQLLVKNKEQMFKDNFLNFSLVFWLFYIGLALVSGFLFTHFLNVEFNAKNDIQESAYEKIAHVDDALNSLNERSEKALEDYESSLILLVQKYKNSGENETRQQLEKPPYNIEPKSLSNRSNIVVREMVSAHMVPYYMNEQLGQETGVVIKVINNRYQRVFKSWDRFSLVHDYMALNTHVESALKTINEKIEKLPINNEPIETNFNKENLPLNNLVEFNKRFKPDYIIPIVTILGIHLFLLLPFFIKKFRKYTGPNAKPGIISDLTIQI